jgi:hypothetical protein
MFVLQLQQEQKKREVEATTIVITPPLATIPTIKETQ